MLWNKNFLGSNIPTGFAYSTDVVTSNTGVSYNYIHSYHTTKLLKNVQPEKRAMLLKSTSLFKRWERERILNLSSSLKLLFSSHYMIFLCPSFFLHFFHHIYFSPSLSLSLSLIIFVSLLALLYYFMYSLSQR
jgi:hypothetical protein